MKINRLDHTKKLYPHFFDKTDESNFTKHLKIVGKPQQELRHKLKTVEWSRILEKPLQIWKEQTKPYKYTIHFRCIVPYLKEVTVYKNPIVNNEEEIISYEEIVISQTFNDDSVNFFEREYSTETETYERDGKTYQNIIPNDTYVLEVKTWDDYRFIKGFPENDYTVKEDNILNWQYNTTFLDISLEEISYSKFLTFRVHKDKIKAIIIYKNEIPFPPQTFDKNFITSTSSIDFSYYYFEDDEYDSYYEIEEQDANNVLISVDDSRDEYVFRLLLKDEDFDEKGIVKDTYDLEVVTYEKRYKCLREYDRVYRKRYAGYDNQLNDCFDHDYSLDVIGNLLNIHRFRFYQVYRENDEYYSKTYPSYNNRSTEDDYHYMKRIQYYISNYNHIPFPILEFWKYYYITPSILSRKRIIDEMDYAYFHTFENTDVICDDMFINLKKELDDLSFEDLTNEEQAILTKVKKNEELTDDELKLIKQTRKNFGEYLEKYGVTSITNLLNEKFDEEIKAVTEYSINKATFNSGESVSINNGEWYESVIVNNVYVVPNANYRLRVGIKDNEDEVTIRLICYNRKGVELRTTGIITTELSEEEQQLEHYTNDTDYTYTDTKITIPSDTASVKLVLESNSEFSFNYATFERMNVVNFDNYYMGTDEEYNSNVYELHTIYEDIPTNIRIGSIERFNILLKRSLPLTKQGHLFLTVGTDLNNNISVKTDTKLYLKDIIQIDTHTITDEPYELTIENNIIENMDYILSYKVLCPIVEENIDDEELIQTQIKEYYEESLVTVTAYYLTSNNEIIDTEILEEQVFADTLTKVTEKIVTPIETSKIKFKFESEPNTVIKEIKMGREQELMDSEVFG